MFAVCVDLHIHPEHLTAFLPLLAQNATASRNKEPGCSQFDVVQSGNDPTLILLYETYTDAEAFAAHLKTQHFQEFDTATSHMIRDKTIRTGPRIHPSP